MYYAINRQRIIEKEEEEKMTFVKTNVNEKSNKQPRGGCSGSGTGGCKVNDKFDSELNKSVFSAIQTNKLNQSCVSG